ncbi:AraC family transcriptional regulator [Terriglobus aquaticus]|uniref:AraC family transcriptional regulator n=1 Tax=Terriglobus aquaticus TaxID=940139 RepID=A0ABW9KI88_9BACT|nr:AraC family transcriptional regulator [Terriglobus aquaticus]
MGAFVDLVSLLRPRATLWSRVEATANWSLQFHAHNDLLFCRVERGACELALPDAHPISLQQDSFVLVRTSTPFRLQSGPGVEAVNSEALITGAGAVAQLGSGEGPSAVLAGGKFVFDTANEDLLTGLLPQVVHLSATNTASTQVRALLAMNQSESERRSAGSDFVIARLMELTLIEILRSGAFGAAQHQRGLLAGLSDPVTARALNAMHDDVAHAWTTAELARLCGSSRSSFAARFTRVIGVGPIEYLQHWRIALAKDELRRGVHTIGEIALSIGFQSGSAFSTAFTRAVGCSPRSFAESGSRGPRKLSNG